MTFRRTPSTLIIAAALVTPLAACSSGTTSPSPTAEALTSIVVSFSENIADEVPLWIADEAGYFREEGLQVELRSLASDQGFPALVAGQVQLASMGGTQIVAGAAGGVDVKMLAALTPVSPFQLYANVATLDELRGKKLGYTSKSGSVYIATLAALKQANIDPSEVNLVPLGSTANVNSALLAGSIDAAVTHPPASLKFDDAGLHMLIDLAAQRIPTVSVGISSTTAYINEHPDVIDKFMRALKKGFDREVSDQAYATQVMGAHLEITDQRALDQTYTFYSQEVLPKIPEVTVAALESSRQALIGSVDGVENLDLAKLIDNSFVDRAFKGA